MKPSFFLKRLKDIFHHRTTTIRITAPANAFLCAPLKARSRQHYRNFVDAENLMPLATSDFRNPVCLEMRNLAHEADKFLQHNIPPLGMFPEVDVDVVPPTKKTNGAELASMDSSDTFASCTTHPFNSQGDLASEILEPTIALDSNLYVNPLDKSSDNSPTTAPPPVPPPPQRIPTVKKSASGDTALRSLGASPIEEQECFSAFGKIMDRGSRVSLNDSPGPKHRKTRFQAAGPRTRFGDSQKRNSQESLEKRKKISLMPARGLASATRILNQHLFGHNLGGSRSGKNGGSKSSLSVDSMDSRTSPQLELHRRSKSILKKADSGGSGRGKDIDPESERLISDNGSGIFDTGADYSPSPPPSRLSGKSRSSKMHTAAYQQELDRTRTLKSQLFLLDDIMNKQGEVIGKGVPSAEVNQVPLYICPPPPPMDEVNYSPTEESRLLPGLATIGATSTPPSCRQPNSVSKGPVHPSA